jgi:serralysin
MTDVAEDTSTEAEVENGVYHGHIGPNYDTDWIAVELTAGVTYTFKALGSDSDNGTIEYANIVNVHDSNGNPVNHTPEDFYTLRQAEFYFTTESQTAFTPSSSGTYYVAVNGQGFDIGSFTLYVTQDQEGDGSNETLTGGSGNDSILGGCGDDVITGGDGNDYLDGEWGDDQLTGGDGADKFTFYSDNWDDIRDEEADLWGNDTITDFNPDEDTIHFAGRLIDNLDELTITESGGDTIIEAYWGDSVTLEGVSANDLTDDNFQFRVGVRITGGNIEGHKDDDNLTGTAADDTIYGHGGNDTITGGDGENYLRGFDGNDLITGGSDFDLIGGGEGNDTINAGAGDDYILAHEGNDSVSGGSGNDLIETNIGNDTLDGGTGNDTLRPGQGDDEMSGGTGNDTFVIGRDWGDDVISDFSISADTLDFQGSGLDIADLDITGSGGNTIISDGTNTLTLEGVNSSDFNSAASDIILEAGSVTSNIADFDDVDTIGNPTSNILTTTGIVNDGGARWTPDDDGVTRVSYSFLTDGSTFYSEDDEREWWTAAVEEITPLTQYHIEQEIARIETYTNLDLVWVEDHGDSGANIRIGFHEFVIGGASSTPYEGHYSAEVYVGIHVGDASGPDIFIHEFGHSLGFNDLPEWNDLTGEEYTVMSYIKSARYEDAWYSSADSDSYMYAGIAGLQYLYGVDEETTAGNDTFTFDVSVDDPYLETIFDAGGTDTIQVTGSGDPVHIDLTPGSWSNIGPDIHYQGEGGVTVAYEPGTIFIMPNTTIENAFGGDGDDTLTGNDANNVLRGGLGHDYASGGAGNDALWAGAGDTGNDTLLGGSGNDTLAGGAGDDSITGGSGNDFLFGGDGNDILVGSEADGGDGANTIWAGTGDDVITGADGNDAIGGGVGDDQINAGDGDDLIYGGKDAGDTGQNDVIDAGAGNDTVFAGAGNDTIDGGEGNDNLYSGAGTDIVDGGAGNDTLWGGGGDDTFTGGNGADTFIFQSGHGDDTVTDFDTDDDILDLSGTATDFANTADVEAAASDTAGGLLIDLGSGNSVLLEGLSISDLSDMELEL